MKKFYLKNKNGITLVALVITIILLLILAGISIATLTGSGLFEKARLAEQKSKNGQELEDTTLKDYENKITEYVDGTRAVTNNVLYPDYTNREKIAFTNKSYVVEKDGYIQISFRYPNALTSDVTDYFTINDVRVFWNGINAKYANVISPLFLVKSGDVVTYSNTA